MERLLYLSAMELKDGEMIWALGLMSGTSLDGVDAALVLTDGVSIDAFGAGACFPYGEGDVEALSAAMADGSFDVSAPEQADRAVVELAETEVEEAHAVAVARLLSKGSDAPALIGFHGQTVAHAPEVGWTWQLGDGERLATTLNRPVVWDFRSADMAVGGEGAPLAPFYHWALARRLGIEEPVAFLNIGGVGNVTWVDPAAASPDAPGALVAFDTGPGNALINDWMMATSGASMDFGGAAAAAGTADRGLTTGANALKDYLTRPAPKSLDRNAFAGLLGGVKGMSAEDGAATLTALTVDCVAAAVPHLPSPPSQWLVCGGGRRNGTMMQWLGETLNVPVKPVEDFGLDGDLMEAQAFAYLAVRSTRGLPLSAPGTTGCKEPVTGGKLSFPASS
ncbi:MAG: anhydro-N-acetylmuramic acid kinase [Pseudomonadota bacterium]